MTLHEEATEPLNLQHNILHQFERALNTMKINNTRYLKWVSKQRPVMCSSRLLGEMFSDSDAFTAEIIFTTRSMGHKEN